MERSGSYATLLRRFAAMSAMRSSAELQFAQQQQVEGIDELRAMVSP